MKFEFNFIREVAVSLEWSGPIFNGRVCRDMGGIDPHLVDKTRLDKQGLVLSQWILEKDN